MAERSLNLDFAGRISELESMMNRFALQWIIYKLIFRGKGIEFDGYRTYTPDDDAGMIDWMASSRSQDILVKKYIEERDLNIMFIIDVSDSMVFGSTSKLKCEHAAEIAAALSHLIIVSGDNIGFGFFDEKFKKIITPKGGKRTFNIFANDLADPDIYGGKPARLGDIFEYLVDYLSSSVNAVFFLSDFLHLGDNFAKNFQIFSQKFETIPLIIRDPLDEALPELDTEFVLQNPHGSGQMVVNSLVAKREYEKKAKEDKIKLMKIFEDSAIEPLELNTKESFVASLVEFLNQRARKRRVVTPGR